MAVEHSGEVIEFEWQDTDDHPRHEAVRKLQELSQLVDLRELGIRTYI